MYVWCTMSTRESGNNLKYNENKHKQKMKQKMKQKVNGLKRQTYLPPCAEIIQIESPTVLCASGASSLLGNSTESVPTNTFSIP